MAVQQGPLQFKRGTSAEVAAVTPAVGEPVYDRQSRELRIGDGTTLGGNSLKGTNGLFSVVDFGAGKGGDDSTAFEQAAQKSKVAVNITGARGSGGIARAPMCMVMIPDGTYNLTRLLDVANRDVRWMTSPGAVINGVDFINGNVFRIGQRQNSTAIGSVDYACGYSIRVNNPEMDAIAEVTGVPTEAGFGAYEDRDTVGLYVDNTSQPALIVAPTATYTATTATIGAQSADVLKRLRVGMFIDTGHSPNRYTGILHSWSADGSVLTVGGWYLVNNLVNPASTPPGTTGLSVNAYLKIWAHNANIYLMANGAAKGGTLLEGGIYNYRGDATPNLTNIENRTWGIDMPSLGTGTYRNQAAFINRGKWVYGHTSFGDTLYPFAAFDEGNYAYWRVDNTGSIELGKVGNGVAAPVYLDFHTSGTGGDYDSRIIATGGSASIGQGTVQISAAMTLVNSLTPSSNNTYDLGSASNGWKTGWFGVVNTGTVTAGSANLGSIELGGDNTAVVGTRVFDAHTSGNPHDYDSRIEFSSGSATVGQGAVTIRSASLDIGGTMRPITDLGSPIGQVARRYSNGYIQSIRPGAGGVIWTSGTGTPEGTVAAPVGSMFTRTDGGANTTLYIKETGTGNTGWVAK